MSADSHQYYVNICVYYTIMKVFYAKQYNYTKIKIKCRDANSNYKLFARSDDEQIAA